MSIVFKDIVGFKKTLNNQIQSYDRLKEHIGVKNFKIESIDTLAEFGRNVDVEALKILKSTQKAFSPLHVVKKIKNKEGLSAAFCIIDWTRFTKEYKKMKADARDIHVAKDFLRAVAVYYDKFAETYNDENSVGYGSKVVTIHPIVYVPKMPAMISISDTSKYLEHFITNPNTQPLQIVFLSKDSNNHIGNVVIRTSVAIAKLAYGIKGSRVHKSIDSAIKHYLDMIVGENQNDDID